EATVYAGTGRL
nr:Chain C, Aspartokinase [Mycobacterium tuberculosis H37Rv]